MSSLMESVDSRRLSMSMSMSSRRDTEDRQGWTAPPYPRHPLSHR